MGLGPESAGQRGQDLKLDKRGFLNVGALIYNREFNTLSEPQKMVLTLGQTLILEWRLKP